MTAILDGAADFTAQQRVAGRVAEIR
jgi:hypothetical protein